MVLVSVIIPIFNKESYMKKTIECVLNQTFRDFELILINDGSVDGSGEIAKEFQNFDSRISYYYQENKGVAASRNTGIKLSKGKYITFLDADDRWDLNFLEEMIKSIKKNNVCYCGHYYLLKGSKKKGSIKFREGDILTDYIKNTTTPNTNSWLIKSEYIKHHNIYFPETLSWGEDMSFFIKVLFHDQDITCSKKYLTEYHMDTINSLSENSIGKIEEDIVWMELAKSYILLNETNEKRKYDTLRFFDTYRIPAAIIYRLNSNCHLSKIYRLSLMKSYLPYISKFEITNGIRSIKLLLYKYRINRYLN